MKKSPLISIIVPVYNVESCLELCITSIINQTYTNIEIILVDDGSTDSSGAICDFFKDKDKRIKVIHKCNGGLSDARNKGLAVANGDFLGFVDSDDWLDIRMYEILMKNLLLYEADISVCEKVVVENAHCTDLSGCDGVRVTNKEEALEILLRDVKYKSHVWNKLFKKELFSNITFPKDKYYEDVFIMHLIYEKAHQIVFIDTGLYYYLQRRDSIVHMKDTTATKDFFEALETRFNWCKNDYQKKLVLLVMIREFSSEKKKMLHSDLSHTSKIEYNTYLNTYYQKYIRKAEVSFKTKLKSILCRYAPAIEEHLEKVKKSNGSIIRILKAFKKFFLYQALSEEENEIIVRLKQTRSSKRILLMGSPEYNNLGDLAIAYCTKKFVNCEFPSYEFIEITERLVLQTDSMLYK